MPYEPLVLLHRLAPEDVNHLIRQNTPIQPAVNPQQQNVQKCQNNGEGSAQSLEKNVVAGGSAARSENQQKTVASSSSIVHVSTASSNDMVNSTAQHPKTRNSTSSAIGVNSNSNSTSVNSAASTRDPTIAKDHITDETNLIMTSKSPLSAVTPVIEVVDKKTKEVLINNHVTSDEHNSSGLSLRTRTISSTTAPVPFHQSTILPSNSVHLNCSTSAVNGRRPRGRRPLQKTLNRVTNGKILQHASIRKSDESKVCKSNLIISKQEPSTSGLDRLQQKQLSNYCNGITKYNDKQDNSNKALSNNVVNKHSTLLPGIDKSKESVIRLMCNKKSNYRKRKQCDSEESVAEKRFMVSDSLSDSLKVQKNPIETPSLPSAKKTEVTFGFLKASSTKYFNSQRAAIEKSNFPLYGHTYWPTNWEYSGAALTGHVHKKVTKDELRKIRQINSAEANNKTVSIVSSKTNSNLKKSQLSVLQRRRSTNRLIASPASTSVEIPNCSKQNTSTTSNTVKRKKPGRPPKNSKLLQRVMKSNCPRKSPRQHASTLAAIKLTKGLDNGDKLVTLLSDKATDVETESDKKPLDMDRPCVLPIAVPKSELKLSERHIRHRRQLDYPHSILIDRRRKRRSITPPPPKLCAQQPVSQRYSCINSASGDQEVKLRTKHVDVVRRRARDERLRSTFVCKQLRKVYKVAEQVKQDLVLDNENCQSSVTSIPLVVDQDQIWLSQTPNSHQELDNMCLQIMYEQTGDTKFLCTNLTDETWQIYNKQRELASAECINNNYYGDTLASDLGMDMIIAGNKRKKKRPNMTGWPKEKRRKTIATSNSTIADVETPQHYDRIVERRRKAAEKQRLRRLRIKLEQQQLAKEKSKLVTASVPKRPRRRPGPKKKRRTVSFNRRTTSVCSNVTVESSETNNSAIKIKRRGRRKNTILNQQQNRKSIQNEIKSTLSVPKATVAPKTVVKRRLGRPKGSVGHRKKIKLEMSQRARNQASLMSDRQKENIAQQQISTGKLKCVISTRNNRMKLLSSKNSFAATSNKKKLNVTKIKKSAGGVCNTSSSSIAPPPSSATTVSKSARIIAKKKRLQQLQQQATSTATTWDVGRPKRYHSANHSRVGTNEDSCFVGSQPFEQHCPNGGVGLSQNTVLDSQEIHHKENNTVHGGL